MQLATMSVKPGQPIPADPNAVKYYVLYTHHLGRMTFASRPAADDAIERFGRQRLVRVNYSGAEIDLG